MSHKTNELIVEGWRFICQSYAIVNQWQLLSLLKRKDLRLAVRDRPYFNPDWNRVVGVFEPEEDAALAAIRVAAADEHSAATLRMIAPYDFSLAPEGRTAIFGTTEFRTISSRYLACPVDVASLAREESLKIVTPSRWSALGFLRFGLRPEQVAIVPHGVDVATFKPPTVEDREAARQRLGLSGFVFLSVGAMTGGKGIDLLLRAFAELARLRPDIHLLLKGTDDVYGSDTMVDGYLRRLPEPDQRLIAERLTL